MKNQDRTGEAQIYPHDDSLILGQTLSGNFPYKEITGLSSSLHT